MRIILIICMLIPNLSFGNKITPDVIRKSFHACILDESKTEIFFELVSQIENPNNLELAYQAAAYAMMAKVSFNPYNKYVYAKKYTELIDQVVTYDSDNIEIRFLRLAIDHNMPMFFGRSKNKDLDLMAVMDLIDGMMPDFDTDFRKYILYFLEHDILMEAEDLIRIKASFN